MTITSNIFFGITAWTPAASYSVGNRRSNGGNAYQCTKSGTSASSGGPTGTGSAITDGTVIWKYLAHVDYVTLASWASGIPGALTQPIVGLLWDCGAITTTAGTAYLTLSGHTTSSTNNITLKPAPGEGIRDFLAAGVPLAFNASQGVRFILPNATGNINYFVVNDNNVIIEGLQVQDPLSTSNSSLLATRAPASLILRDCIFDGYPQPGGAGLVDFAANVTCYNCLFVDRTVTGGFGSRIGAFYAAANSSSYINCTIVSIATPASSGGAVGAQGVTGCFVRNCGFFGYDQIVDSGATSALSFDHCAFSKASPIGGLSTDGGGNLFSVSAGSQFVDAATDFRLKTPSASGSPGPFSSDFSSQFSQTSSSSLVGSGLSDTADIPSADDIAAHVRLTWDIGAWAYTVLASGSASLETLRASSSPTGAAFSSGFSSGFVTGVTSNAAAVRNNIDILSSATLAQIDRSSGVARMIFLVCQSTATQTNGSSSNGSPWSGEFSSEFGPVSNAITVSLIAFLTTLTPIGTAQLTQPASGSASISISAVGQASVSNATARPVFFVLSAASFADQLGTSTIGIMTLSCVAIATPALQFIGLANIDWAPAVAPLTSSTNSSATSNMFRITASTQLGQRTFASGGANIDLSAGGAIGSSASTANNILALAAVATAITQDLASGLATIDVLSVRRAIPPLLEGDAITPLVLAADGSGLLLAADVIVPNISSTTFGAGIATIPSLACAAQAFLQIFWSGTETISIAAAAQAQQFELASATAAIPAIRVAAIAVQRGAAAAAASFEPLAASAQVGQVDASAGLATIPTLSVSGVARSFTGTAASASISISAIGLALTSGTAIARATAFSLAASGTASFVLGASGAARIALSAAAQLGQVNSVSGSAAIQVAGTGTAAVGMPASGSATIPTLSASCSASLTLPATGIGIIPTLAASAAAVNTVEVARGAAVFMSLASFATAEVHGTSMSGVSSIIFSGGGTIISAVEASVLVELEQIVAAHARLWTTPIGYEQGDLVVYWQD